MNSLEVVVPAKGEPQLDQGFLYQLKTNHRYGTIREPWKYISVFPGISEVSVPVHVRANPFPLYKTPSKRNPGLLLAIHFGVPYSGYQLLAGIGSS